MNKLKAIYRLLRGYFIKWDNHLRKTKCERVGHLYQLNRHVTVNIREAYCSRCEKEFLMDDEREQIIPLTEEQKRLNKYMFDQLKPYKGEI